MSPVLHAFWCCGCFQESLKLAVSLCFSPMPRYPGSAAETNPDDIAESGHCLGALLPSAYPQRFSVLTLPSSVRSIDLRRKKGSPGIPANQKCLFLPSSAVTRRMPTSLECFDLKRTFSKIKREGAAFKLSQHFMDSLLLFTF